jgi:hypothetical protein
MKANKAAAVDAPITILFAILRHRRCATAQQRSLTAHEQ